MWIQIRKEYQHEDALEYYTFLMSIDIFWECNECGMELVLHVHMYK